MTGMNCNDIFNEEIVLYMHDYSLKAETETEGSLKVKPLDVVISSGTTLITDNVKSLKLNCENTAVNALWRILS